MVCDFVIFCCWIGGGRNVGWRIKDLVVCELRIETDEDVMILEDLKRLREGYGWREGGSVGQVCCGVEDYIC